MGRFLFSTVCALLVFCLSGCDDKNSNLKMNTVSEATLTEREKAILLTASDQSFVFDFQTDDVYKKVSVWVEKYESGKWIEDINRITTEIKNEGTIIFTTSKTDAETNQAIFAISINSDKSTGSGWGPVKMTENVSGIIQGSNLTENIPITGPMVLASICYTTNSNEMSSLSADFYEDPASHLDEIENFDIVYLLKSEFSE